MKEKLLEHVILAVENRMQTSWAAMQAAQASANEEGKSSAGDKYETARAMGQLDREMHGKQYAQAKQERMVLERINPKDHFSKVNLGALVRVSSGWFFLAVSAGSVEIDGQTVLVVSPQSPIGQLLMGKAAKETFVFRGNTESIIGIY